MRYIPTYTEQGIELMNKYIAQGNSQGPPFLRVDVGAGEYDPDESLTNLTEIKDVRQRMPISSVTLTGKRVSLVRFVITNLPNVHLLGETNEVAVPYNIQSFGIIARDPDVGEILYAVFTPEDEQRDQITPYIENTDGDLLSFNFNVAISEAEVIYLVAGTGAFALADEFVAHVTDKNNPHGVTIDQLDYEGRPLRTYLKSLEDAATAEKAIALRPVQTSVPVYDGKEKSLTDCLGGFDADVMTLGGTIKATDAGWNTATVTPKHGYYWSDTGTSEPRDVPWRIAGISVAVPAQVEPLRFTGAPQSANLGEIPEGVTMSGDLEATEAGTRQATATLDPNYEWEDETIEPKSIPWTIEKAPGSQALNKKSVSLTLANMTQYVLVTRSGDGEISAISDDPKIAAATAAGEQVTITGKKTGNTNVRVHVAAGKNYLAPDPETISVACTVPTSDVSEMTAADIKAIVDAGRLTDYFTSGDLLPAVPLKGTIAGENYDLKVRHKLVHNDNGHPIFLLWAKEDGTPFSLRSPGFYSTYIEANASGLCMNRKGQVGNQAVDASLDSSAKSYGPNKGGWAACLGRIICEQYFKCLPADMQAIIRTSTIWTDNTGNVSNTAAAVTSTQDKVYLPGEVEIFGRVYSANENTVNKQTQWDFFKAGNQWVSDIWTFLRDPHRSSTTAFCGVGYGGGYGNYSAATSNGFRPAFSV